MTLYAQRDPRALEPHLSRHMEAMTSEGLHDKGDIATELAWRDAEIERLSHAVRLAASQKLPDEMNAREFADWQHGYEALVKLARAAIAKENK